jgi:hypothetical protein
VSIPTRRRYLTHTVSSRWLAEAELQTFSESRQLVARSPYLSHQLTFSHFPRDFDLTGGHLGPPVTGVSVRKEVESSKAVSNEHLRLAMHSVLDLTPSDVRTAPAFGNGWGGKQGSWKDTLPARAISMAPKLQQVRQMGRRIPKASYAEDKTALSFEDDTLLLANNSSEDDAPSLDHTSGTSWSDPATQDPQDSWAHWNATGSLNLPSPVSPAAPMGEHQMVEPFALDEDIIPEVAAKAPLVDATVLSVPTGNLISLGASPESDASSGPASTPCTGKKAKKTRRTRP